MSLPNQSTLIVPIQLSAIYVEAGRSVMDAFADFSRLPWSDGKQDFNSSTPFLGESVLSPPFQDRNFTLAAGVHLHWVLPEAHRTYHVPSSNEKKSPSAAPNRWLIQSGSKKWIVESDYINKNSTIHNRNAVTVPSAEIGMTGKQPYLYLGRQLPLNEWLKEETNSDNYWQSLGKGPLTSFGYGELAFNSFYPNCRSVFGFFDPDAQVNSASNSYEVFGWYSNEENDILNDVISELNTLLASPQSNPSLLKKVCDDDGNCPAWLEGLINLSANKNWPKEAVKTTKNYKDISAQVLQSNPSFTLGQLFAVDTTSKYKNEFYQYGIMQALDWTLESEEGYPTKSCYYGTVEVNRTTNFVPSIEGVAVGSSGTEALSAYLHNELEASEGSMVEDYLNAILLGSKVQNDLVDIDLNFKESLHDHQFTIHDHGVLWTIRKLKDSDVTVSNGATSKGNDLAGEITLPDHLAELLNVLNVEQSTYQRGVEEVEVRMQSLYHNWSKYMHSCYPPLGTNENYPDDDLIQSYLQWELENLKALINRVGTLTPVPKKEHQFTSTGLMANNVVTALENLMNSLAQVVPPAGYSYELSHTPAPRYYKPKDPVVLFAIDDSSGSSNPESSSGPLNVAVGNVEFNTSNGNANALPCQMLDIVNVISSNSSVDFQSQEQWSPQILQWLTEFFPTNQGSNVSSGDGQYLDSYITFNNTLPLDEFNWVPKEGIGTQIDALEYSGSTYISSGTKRHFKEALKSYLVTKYSSKISDENFDADCKSVFRKGGDESNFGNAGYVAWKAYKYLENLTILTQSIGGFYDALLQQAQNIEIPIKDPLAFKDYQGVTNRVGDILKGAFLTSPLQDNRFLPLVTGKLNLMRLELIDRFGIATRPELSNLVVSNTLKLTSNEQLVWLSPRFAQEARLNLRWLAASTSDNGLDIEMNSHPASSPVCGWLLPNYFDGTLMIYDSEGKGIGYFSEYSGKMTWNSSPLETGSTIPNISKNTPGINPHLLKILLNIEQGNNLGEFMDQLEASQDNISPEFFAGHDSLAILIGKPIAVVRASISVETKGERVYDQGWIPFTQQLQGSKPFTDGYEKVVIPVRLGENTQINDGLIAFWNESSESNTINWVNNPGGISQVQSTNTIEISLASNPKTLTMLMDPHGIVHATSGVFPVKTINIPPDQYTKALKNIEVTFNIQPILTPQGKLQLSLPKEEGYQWSWLQKTTSGSITLPDYAIISNPLFQTTWKAYLNQNDLTDPTVDALWSDLLRCQWLMPVSEQSNWYQIKILDDTIKSAMTSNYSSQQIANINQVLSTAASGLVPYSNQARFYPRQELVEGQLVLSQVSKEKTNKK